MSALPRLDVEPGPLVLRSTMTSPYGRKVRIAADVLGLTDRIRIEPADTLDEDDSLRAQNPLGKMPCLLLGDGTALYDSRVILEFLQALAGGERLIPADGLARFQALTAIALADGITDAALLMVYERRFRPDGPWSERWLDHQRGKIQRGLTVFEGLRPDPARTDAVTIGLACALAYLDWRKPLEWRPSVPALATWLDAFAANEPAFERSFPATAEPKP